jgi:hypothetical protein
MYDHSIIMNIACEVCDKYEYKEHDSGYYVCTECGNISNIRYGLQADYGDHNMRGRMKRNSGEEDEDMDEGFHVIETPDQTTTLTTCNNSVYNDIRKPHNKQTTQKSLTETLSEHQAIFILLFKTIYYYLLYLRTGSKMSNKTHFIAFFEERRYGNDFTNLFEIAKITWEAFLAVEYSNQINMKKPKWRGSYKVRSRRNTEDEKMDKVTYSVKKKRHVREELKERQLKSKNIGSIEDYKKSTIKNKDKMRKFIEEYDQVMMKLKENKDFSENIIDYNEGLSLKTLIQICNYLNIPIHKGSYEDTIHQLFLHHDLNYLTLYSEKNYDESQSNLNGNHYLSMFDSIFNFNSNHIILFRDLISFFKNFEINYLFDKDELKLLKYACKDKLLKLIYKNQTNMWNAKICDLIKLVCEDRLKLPKFFTKFCYNLFILLEVGIKKRISFQYSYESFILGIVIYSLKLFYGLNDLPYLVLEKSEGYSDNKILQNAVHLLLEYGAKDKLYHYYSQMPSLSEIVNTLVELNKEDRKNSLLWESQDFKQYYHTLDYKDKYIQYNNEHLYKVESSNSYSLKHINELENKYKSITSVPITGKKVTLKVSEKFKTKMARSENKQLRPFVVEEIEYYNQLAKKTKKPNCLEIPLPCDNYIRFNKKAFKFEGVSLPESELLIYFYFSKYFNTSFKVLKKTCRVVEGLVEKKFEK